MTDFSTPIRITAMCFLTTDDGQYRLAGFGHDWQGDRQHACRKFITVVACRLAGATAMRWSKSSSGLVKPQTTSMRRNSLKNRLAFVSFNSEIKSLNHHDVGRSLMEVSRTAANLACSVPIELTLLGKTLLQLEEVGKVLCPDFNPTASGAQKCC